MNIRIVLIAAGLATLAGGCTYTPDYGYGDRGYPPYYGVYRDTDSYDGYFYVQIIYIDGEPWYVDDYRRAHPVPPNLRSHFRNSAWVRSLPPRFGHDDDERDGYRLSRIVYVNDEPRYVDDDRRARPLPAQVRSRFSYREVVRSPDAGGSGREPQFVPQPVPQPRYDNGPRPLLPSSGRERERELPPAYGPGQEREAAPSQGRERERMAPPAAGAQTTPKPAMTPERTREAPQQGYPVQPSSRDGRGEPAGRSMQPPSDGRERERMAPPAYGPQTMPKPAMTPERVREVPQGRPVQPSLRDGRSEPAGRSMEKPADRETARGRPTQQESGRKANAEGRKDEKATGSGKGHDDDRKEQGRGRGNQPGD